MVLIMRRVMPPMGVDIKLLKKKRRRRAVWGAVILLSLACVYFPDPYEVAQTGSRYLVNLPDTKTTGPGSKPNFVVFMLSQWRYDWDGLHPHGVKGNAPLKLDYFKEVAKTGTRFTQAYSPSPLTAPARACFAMGKEYDATGVLNADPNGLVLDKEETTTFYKLLRDVGGYHTMMVGADELYPQDARFPTFPGEFGTPAHDLGFSDAKRIASNTAMNDAQHKDDLYKNYLELVQVEANNSTFSGLDVYKDCMKGSTSSLCLNTTFTDHIHPDHFVANAAQELLSRRKRDKPYYLQVNFPALSLSTAEMAERVKDRFWPPPFDNVHPEQWACPEYTGQPQIGGRCNYASQLERIDTLMQSISTMVNKQDTVICITADHGDMLGDHNSILSDSVPWQPSVSAPLVCRGPGILQNKVHTEPVSILDLVGTVLQLAGVVRGPRMTSKSLWPILSEGQTENTVVHTGLSNWRAVVKSIHEISYKLVCCKGMCPAPLPTKTPLPRMGEEFHLLLYDITHDPNDMYSLTKVRPDIVEELRKEFLDGFCQEAPAPTRAPVAIFGTVSSNVSVLDASITNLTMGPNQNLTILESAGRQNNVTIHVEIADPNQNITITETDVTGIEISAVSPNQNETANMTAGAVPEPNSTVAPLDQASSNITTGNITSKGFWNLFSSKEHKTGAKENVTIMANSHNGTTIEAGVPNTGKPENATDFATSAVVNATGGPVDAIVNATTGFWGLFGLGGKNKNKENLTSVDSTAEPPIVSTGGKSNQDAAIKTVDSSMSAPNQNITIESINVTKDEKTQSGEGESVSIQLINDVFENETITIGFVNGTVQINPATPPPTQVTNPPQIVQSGQPTSTPAAAAAAGSEVSALGTVQINPAIPPPSQVTNPPQIVQSGQPTPAAAGSEVSALAVNETQTVLHAAPQQNITIREQNATGVSVKVTTGHGHDFTAISGQNVTGITVITN